MVGKPALLFFCPKHTNAGSTFFFGIGYTTVREFATLAFKEAGIELRWEGEGVNEKGIDVKTGKALVEVDPKYFRPCEVEQLLGDPTKAKTLLGWNPTKTSFPELVKIMVAHDMKFAKKLYLKAQTEE